MHELIQRFASPARLPRRRSAAVRTAVMAMVIASMLVGAAAFATPASVPASAPAPATTPRIKVGPYQLSAYWNLTTTSVNAMVPNSGPDVHLPACASVRYVIGTDGQPHDASLGKVEPASSLGSTAVGIVEQFRYAPGPRNRRRLPVATFYTVQFNLRDKTPAARRRLTAACALSGYGVPHAVTFQVK